MLTRLQLFPEQASTLAPQTDALFLFLLGITAFFVVLIAGSIIVFMLYYRRRDPDAIPPPIHGSLALEVLWSGIPFILVMIVFFWGARLYATIARPTMRSTSTSSASSGCGRSSTWRGAGRSTSSTFPSESP